MKVIHLGYYRADYPSLGLAGVDPAAEVDISDPEVATAVMVEGIFAPADAQSKQLLTEHLTAAAIAEQEAARAAEREAADRAAALEAEAAKAAAEQEARLAQALADIEAARAAALKAAKKAVPAGEGGE